MNNPLNLSPSELLSAYLDGELSPQSEKALFEKLASDDVLRSEMRDLLAIHKEIETGAMYYPPAALKTAAMARVGLENAGAAAVFKSAIPVMQKAFVPVASALVGSLLTILFFMNNAPDAESFKKNPADTSFKNNVLKSENPANVILSESEEPTLAEQRGEMNSRLRGNDRISVENRGLLTQKERFRASRNDNFSGIHFKRKSKNNDIIELPEIASAEENSFKNSITEIPEKQFLKENTAQITFKNDDTPRTFKEVLKTFEDKLDNDGILPEKSSWLDNTQFEIRGFSLANYPQPSSLPQSDPIFKNMAIGAYYTVSDEHAIGFESGQEAFSQKFYEIQDDSIRVNWYQYLVLPWGGISYRYSPDISFENIRPLGGITLAVTTGGPVARAIVGAKIFPENAVSMMIAMEGAVFAYQYQDKIFTSPKLGIMYGVSVKF